MKRRLAWIMPIAIPNPPHENATDSELVNWVVTKKSIFYFGSYYGW